MLRILGWLGVLCAVAVLVVGAVVVRPRAEALAGQARQTWALAARAIALAEQSSALIAPSMDALQQGLQASTKMPETLSAASGALLQGAGTLDITATSLDKLQSGITGLVTPGSVGRNAMNARKSADQLRLLGKMVAAWRDDSIAMRQRTDELARTMARVRQDVPELTDLMRQASEQTRAGLNTFESFPVTAMVLGLAAGVALIFLFLGILLLGLAAVNDALSEARAISGAREPSTRKAA